MGISFDEALNNNLISDKTIKLLPSKCMCGSKLRFSDSLKNMICIENNCKSLIINRVMQFSKYVGIDIDYNKASIIVNKTKMITPYQMIILDTAFKSNMISNRDIENIIDCISKIKDKQYYIYEIAKMCGIDDIYFVAYKIFDGFESFEDAYNEIEGGQVSFINERLGIKSSDSTILSLDIFNKLINIKDELIFAETQLKVKRYNQQIINISFSDNVKPFINKYELIDYLNSTYNFKFNLITIINDNTDILIKNFDGNTNKYRASKIINDKFIAEQMNNGKITLADIGKHIPNELKPAGYKIAIFSIEELLGVLDELKGSDTVE